MSLWTVLSPLWICILVITLRKLAKGYIPRTRMIPSRHLYHAGDRILTNKNIYIHNYFKINKRNKYPYELGSTQASSMVQPQSSTSSRPHSFVNDELRPYAMKLHTKDQAKEGEQKAQVPFTKWTPDRQSYLQFLVDSLQVYQTFEQLIAQLPSLSKLRNTGLERSEALVSDIEWMQKFDPTIIKSECGAAGLSYASYLKELVNVSVPRFICHYYNFYFAHTAGGRMIGLKMSELLLDRHTLKFFQWDEDVKTLLEETKQKIDDIASNWTESERQECLTETLSTFQYGGAIMSYLSP